MNTGTNEPLVHLRARWQGELPHLGDYLMSTPQRAKYAYRIAAIEDRGGGDLMLTVSRVSPDFLPGHILVHHWKWDRRSRRRPF